MRSPFPRPLLALLLTLGVLAAGCSSSDDSATSDQTGEGATTSPALTADSVRASAAAAMAAIETVRFSVARSGAEVTIDEAGLVVFDEADGRFAAPASADAVVTVLLLGNRVELGAVAIDGTLYLTDPLTNEWQDVTGTIAFDPAKIFSTSEGIANVLDSGMSTATLTSATPDGDGLLHLEGTVEAADVATLTSGLVSEAATAEIAIDATTSLVETITFDTPIGEETATWLVELSDYGADVEITVPDLAGA